MFEPKPIQTTEDARQYGRVLFSYLLRGAVNGAPVYGLLTLPELELAHHASSNVLAHDASPIAVSRVAEVRYRLALVIARLSAEQSPSVAHVSPEERSNGSARVLLPQSPKPLAPIGDTIAF